MSEHPIQGMMGVTMEKIREMVDVNTIVGNPITTPDGTVILPVSKVSYGFAAGGTDIPSKQSAPGNEFFGGGSGAGITIKPVAFLTVSKGEVKLLNIENNDSPAEKIAGMVPEYIDKISQVLKKDKKDKNSIDDTSLDDPEL